MALVLGGLGAGAFFAWRRPWHHPELQQRQLTSNPWSNPVGAGVISPDGRTLAVVDHTGLSLRAVDSGESRSGEAPRWILGRTRRSHARLVPRRKPAADQRQHVGRKPVRVAIPVLGGRARKIRSDGYGATVSRDGSRIAYMHPAGSGAEIWCADVSGENARRVLPSDSTSTINTWAVWSPKGSRLAYARVSVGPAGFRITLESCDLDGNRREILSSNSEQSMHGFTIALWAPDGRLFFGLTDPPPSQRDMNLWSLHVDPSSGTPSGKPRRITQWIGLSAVLPLGISTDGKRLSVRILMYQSDCYVGRIAPGNSALQDVRRLTLDERMDVEPTWMPDGKSILFTSDRNGSPDIFRQALDASAASRW